MKKPLALLLLFGIVGCSSEKAPEPQIDIYLVPKEVNTFPSEIEIHYSGFHSDRCRATSTSGEWQGNKQINLNQIEKVTVYNIGDSFKLTCSGKGGYDYKEASIKGLSDIVSKFENTNFFKSNEFFNEKRYRVRACGRNIDDSSYPPCKNHTYRGNGISIELVIENEVSVQSIHLRFPPSYLDETIDEALRVIPLIAKEIDILKVREYLYKNITKEHIYLDDAEPFIFDNGKIYAANVLYKYSFILEMND